MIQNIDPYKEGLFSKDPYVQKREINGQLVVILDGKMDNRNLNLITPISRVIKANEIHELIITDEFSAGPGSIVNSIAYLGFFEVEQGSVVVAGDQVLLDTVLIGTIAGFDETHMPNHLNIVIKAERRKTGKELNAKIGMKIRILKQENNTNLF